MNRRQFVARLGVTSIGGILLGACGGSDGGSGPSGGTNPVPIPAPAPTPPPTSGGNSQPGPANPARIVIAFAGSSSAAQYLSLYDGQASSPQVRVSREGGPFSTLDRGVFGKVAGQGIAAALGRTVDFIDGGASATTLAEWADPASSQRRRLVNGIRAAGGADAVLLQIGWNDAARGILTSRDHQLSLFRTLITAIRSEAAIPRAHFFLGGCQNIVGASASRQDLLAAQRLAELDAAAGIDDVSYAFSTYDLPTRDDIHQTEAAQVLSGGRFSEQVIAWAQNKVAPHGPQALSARRTGPATSELRLRLFDNVGFTPASGISGFFVQDANGISPVLSASRDANGVIQLQHRALASGQAWVRYALDSPLGLPGCVRDVSTLGRPMEPTLLTLA